MTKDAAQHSPSALLRTVKIVEQQMAFLRDHQKYLMEKPISRPNTLTKRAFRVKYDSLLNKSPFQ